MRRLRSGGREAPLKALKPDCLRTRTRVSERSKAASETSLGLSHFSGNDKVIEEMDLTLEPASDRARTSSGRGNEFPGTAQRA